VLFRSPLGGGRIEPAAAQRLTARPGLAVLASALIALVATEGGILLSLQKPWPTSFFISSLSFAFYVAAPARVPYAIRR
jgi:zinc/manganese transport system permease protein